MSYTPREYYDWIQGQINGKRRWLAEFSSGKRKFPDHIIAEKERDLSILESMASAYDRKFGEAERT